MFCSPREFSPQSFKDFMFEQSRPIDGTLDVLAAVAAAIFRIALDLVQQDPARVLMIDDRPLNAEAAARAGMHVIHFRDAHQLRDDLRRFIKA